MAMKTFIDRKLLEEEKKISKILEQVCLKADIKLDSQGFPIGLNHHPFNHPITISVEVQTDPQYNFSSAGIAVSGNGHFTQELRDYLTSHRTHESEEASIDQSLFENSVSSSKNWEAMVIEQLAKENEYIIQTKDAEVLQLKQELQEMEENMVRLIKWRNSTVNRSSYLLSAFEKKHLKPIETVESSNTIKDSDVGKLIKQLRAPLQEDPQLSPRFAKLLMNQVIVSSNPQLKEETMIAIEVARQTGVFSPQASPTKGATGSFSSIERMKSDSSLSRLFPSSEVQDNEEEESWKSPREATNFVPFGGQPKSPPPPRPPSTTPFARPPPPNPPRAPPPPRPPTSSNPVSSQEMKPPSSTSGGKPPPPPPSVTTAMSSPRPKLTVDPLASPTPTTQSISPFPASSPNPPQSSVTTNNNNTPYCVQCQQQLLQSDLPFHEMTIHELYPYLTTTREYPLLKLFYLLSLMQYFHSNNSHPLQRQQELEAFQFYALAETIQPPRHLQSQPNTVVEMEKRKKQLLQMSTITKNVMMLFFMSFDLVDEKYTIKTCQDLWELGLLMASRKAGKPRLKLNYSDFVFTILQFVQVKYLTKPSSSSINNSTESLTATAASKRRMSTTTRRGSVTYQNSSEEAIITCLDQFLTEITPLLDHYLMNPKDFDQVMTLYWDLPHDEFFPILAEHQELLYNSFRRTKSYGLYHPEQHAFSLRELVGGAFSPFENYCVNYHISPQLLPLSMVRLMSQIVRRLCGHENTSFFFFTLYSVILYAARQQVSAQTPPTDQELQRKPLDDQKRFTEKLVSLDRNTPLVGKVPPLPIVQMKAILQVFLLLIITIITAILIWLLSTMIENCGQ